jgi:hypothetical protein
MSLDSEDIIIKTAGRMGSPRLSELVDLLVKEKNMKFEDAARSVYILWKKGQLELVEPEPPSNIFAYAADPESLWFWGVALLVAVTLPLVFFASGSPLIYARYVLGSLFVLYLPGSMLIEALYSKAGDLGGLERVALSIGLSLALVPLIGLILNFTPWGIRLVPVTISLALVTLAMAVVALYRKFGYYRLALGGKAGMQKKS